MNPFTACNNSAFHWIPFSDSFLWLDSANQAGDDVCEKFCWIINNHILDNKINAIAKQYLCKWNAATVATDDRGKGNTSRSSLWQAFVIIWLFLRWPASLEADSNFFIRTDWLCCQSHSLRRRLPVFIGFLFSFEPLLMKSSRKSSWSWLSWDKCIHVESCRRFLWHLRCGFFLHLASVPLIRVSLHMWLWKARRKCFSRRMPLQLSVDHTNGFCVLCALARNTAKYLRMTWDNGTVLVMDFFRRYSGHSTFSSSFAFPFGDSINCCLIIKKIIKVGFGGKERDWNYVTEAWRISVNFCVL